MNTKERVYPDMVFQDEFWRADPYCLEVSFYRVCGEKLPIRRRIVWWWRRMKDKLKKLIRRVNSGTS